MAAGLRTSKAGMFEELQHPTNTEAQFAAILEPLLIAPTRLGHQTMRARCWAVVLSRY